MAALVRCIQGQDRTGQIRVVRCFWIVLSVGLLCFETPPKNINRTRYIYLHLPFSGLFIVAKWTFPIGGSNWLIIWTVRVRQDIQYKHLGEMENDMTSLYTVNPANSNSSSLQGIIMHLVFPTIMNNLSLQAFWHKESYQQLSVLHMEKNKHQ